MLVLGLVISVRVRGYRVGIRIKVRVSVRNAHGTKRMGTKRRGYEMSGSHIYSVRIAPCHMLSAGAVAALHQGEPGQLTWMEDPPSWLMTWI